MKQYDCELVAGVIGIPKDEMTVLQHAMDKEEHWNPIDGDSWALTGSGVMAMLDALEIDQEKLPESFWPDIEGCLLKKTAPPLECVVTFQRLTKNRRVVLARKDGQTVRLLVHGHRNKNFVSGMEICATHVEHDLYRINGPSPKKRGRY